MDRCICYTENRKNERMQDRKKKTKGSKEKEDNTKELK